MSAQVEVITLNNDNNCEAITLDGWRPEYQHSEPTGVGGIGSSSMSLLRRTALITAIAVTGTIPLPAEAAIYSGIEATFVFPSSSDQIVEDEYSRIREEIVASGLPMLNDDEVRAEIGERKGARGQ